MKLDSEKVGPGYEKRLRKGGYQLWGWILFMVCAAFFIAASIKNHDALTLAGSIIFLIACVVFLIPLAVKFKRGKG